MKKKLLAGLLSISMVAGTMMSGCGGTTSAEKTGSGTKKHEISSGSFPLHAGAINAGERTLYFLDGVKDLPYVDANDIPQWCEDIMGPQKGEFSFSLKVEGSVATIFRNTADPEAVDNGTYAAFDFDKDSITFLDHDLFCWKPGATTVMDVVSVSTVNASGQPSLLQKVEKQSLDRYGDELVVKAGDYGIDFVQQDGKQLVPLQTLVDFMFSPSRYINLFFNGQVIQMASQMSRDNQEYYAAPTGDRSAALAEFGYNELCMMLDYNYGLKESHGIGSFDKLFHSAMLDKVLKDPDPVNADKCVGHMIFDYLDDGHSAFLAPSYLAGPIDYGLKPGTSVSYMFKEGERFSSARAKYYPNGAPGYEEVGNTAYITFDSFAVLNVADTDSYYQAKDPAEFPDADTIGLVMKAHAQITRENSPIENVVVDLTNNEGGASDAAVFMLAWLLGETSVSVKNTITGAMSSATYRADVNRDRKFDEKDTISDKNIFCLISPFSFSCANLVPNVLKESHRATLLGQTSGGGSCVVQFCSTAWGSSIRLSSSRRLSFLKNGAFYDIDRGAEPDHRISNLDLYYDRKRLTNYINSLQ